MTHRAWPIRLAQHESLSINYTVKMKKLTLSFALAALLLAGCNNDNKEFTTRSISATQCYLLSYDEQMGPWGDTLGLKKVLEVEWPAKGFLSAAAERELMMLCFDDSTSANVDKAVAAWLAKPYIYTDDGEAPHVKTVDTLDESREYSYMAVRCNTTHDSVLATFNVGIETFGAGAAHGIYSSHTLTVDLESGNVVRLTDLVSDTNLLCEAIARAIFDLDANKDIRECLFDEYRNADRMPMPASFFIDSARNNITVSYDLYHIQPYACGIPSVVLPIFWLSKHVPLTPYAKRLFGPDSYVE